MSTPEQQSQGAILDQDKQESQDLTVLKQRIIAFLTTETPGTLPADESAREQQRDDRRDPNRIGLHW